ncbi:hypothetical protein [Methylobacterium tardum]|uniref:hypothetical protein n=1 Tax=Methylobacterium tardum TaxID=374432 RepID=UPI001EDF9F2F|nr:hypothetical protein [Methylobacterium tardum]URD34588.1 hypothetical protein M6G65_18495 [Methylobacterium tardum]
MRTILTSAKGEYGGGIRKDFFLHDRGSARHEDGFHYFLAKFIGWDIPSVPQFDGGEAPLYIETIFPMFFVEQKRGWSAIQGPFPTMFRIQDLNRRVMEFILSLDAGKSRLRYAELRAVMSTAVQRWREVVVLAREIIGSTGRVHNLTPEPSERFLHDEVVKLDFFYKGEWREANELLADLKSEVARLEQIELSETEDASPELEEELISRRSRQDELTSLIEVIRREWSTIQDEVNAVAERLSVLKFDLVRNQDAQKLKTLGSRLGKAAFEHRCPTCHQSLETELLPELTSRTMALEQNIKFIKSQIELYEASQRSAVSSRDELARKYNAFNAELYSVMQRIRELRQALTRPASSASRAQIEQIVRLNAQIERITSAREGMDSLSDNLGGISREYFDAQSEIRSLRLNELGSSDRAKLSNLLIELKRQCRAYHFATYGIEELGLAEDNFRPVVEIETDEGRQQQELGFEVSASDGIRLKWAYYLSLMLVSKFPLGNHPGLCVFDEPGQQAMEQESLREFLKFSSINFRERQIITAVTTEKARPFIEELRGLGANVIEFGGRVLQPLRAT